MAASRILMQLLRNDQIPFTLRPVSNAKHIQQVYEYCLTTDVKSIIMINCGAVRFDI